MKWKNMIFSEVGGTCPLAVWYIVRDRKKQCSHWRGYKEIVVIPTQKDATGPTAPDSPLFHPILLFFSFCHTGDRTQGLTCVQCLATELCPSCGMVSPSLLSSQYLAWEPVPGTCYTRRSCTTALAGMAFLICP